MTSPFPRVFPESVHRLKEETHTEGHIVLMWEGDFTFTSRRMTSFRAQANVVVLKEKVFFLKTV